MTARLAHSIAKTARTKATHRVAMLRTAPTEVPVPALPVHDIRCVAIAAFLSVGAKGDQIEISVLSRLAVNVSLAPGIGNQILPQIRPIPVLNRGGTNPQCLQPLVCRGIAPRVQAK